MKIVSLKKIKALDESGIPYRWVHQGIIIADKVLIAKSKSLWKKVGECDWYPYYGIKNLIDAIMEDRLDEYARDQQNTKREIRAVPKKTNNKFKIINQ